MGIEMNPCSFLLMYRMYQKLISITVLLLQSQIFVICVSVVSYQTHAIIRQISTRRPVLRLKLTFSQLVHDWRTRLVTHYGICELVGLIPAVMASFSQNFDAISPQVAYSVLILPRGFLCCFSVWSGIGLFHI